MGKPISNEQWDALLSAFREEPGNFEHARKTAHCQWRTARESWERGCSKRRPISAILEDEAKMKRAVVAQGAAEVEAVAASERLKMAEQMTSMRAELADVRRMADQFVNGAKQARGALLEAGGLDAARDYEREGQIARTLQAFTINRLGLSAALLDPEAIDNLRNIIITAARNREMPWKEAAQLCRVIGADHKAVAELAEISQKVTRQFLGAPTSITHHTHDHTVTVASPDELRAIDERTAGRLAALRRYGHVPEDDGELESGPVPAALPAPADGSPQPQVHDIPSGMSNAGAGDDPTTV